MATQIFSIFTPKIGEDEPILTNIFQRGWNHQLEIVALSNRQLHVHFCVICGVIYCWLANTTAGHLLNAIAMACSPNMTSIAVFLLSMAKSYAFLYGGVFQQDTGCVEQVTHWDWGGWFNTWDHLLPRISPKMSTCPLKIALGRGNFLKWHGPFLGTCYVFRGVSMSGSIGWIRGRYPKSWQERKVFNQPQGSLWGDDLRGFFLPFWNHSALEAMQGATCQGILASKSATWRDAVTCKA